MSSELADGSLTTGSPGKFRQLDFCGHTFNSYMIDIVFLDIFFFYVGYFKFYFIFKLYSIVLVLPNIEMNPPQVYLFYLTTTYCLRYANYPLDLKGFKNERDSLYLQ